MSKIEITKEQIEKAVENQNMFISELTSLLNKYGKDNILFLQNILITAYLLSVIQ